MDQEELTQKISRTTSLDIYPKNLAKNAHYVAGIKLIT